MKKLSNQHKKYLYLSLIFFLILILNFLTPIIADDFGYSLNLSRNRLESFRDIANFQIIHYQSWGGRTIAHTLAQIYLFLPKWLFNIANSFCFITLIYLIYSISKNNSKEKPHLLFVIFLAIYFILPAFGQDCLWLTGACNYLWTTTIVLLLIEIYVNKRIKKDNPLNISFLFILGIISGWTNENTGFASIIILILIILENRKEISKWQISGLIGNILGFVILLLAPGNYIREDGYQEEISFLMKVTTRFIDCTYNYLKYLMPLIIIMIILITIYKYKKKNIPKKILIYLTGSLIALYAMVLSPTFPERAWFSVSIFLLLAVMTLLFELDNLLKKQYLPILSNVIIIGFLYFSLSYIDLTKDMIRLKETWNHREKVLTTTNKKSYEFEIYQTTNSKNPAYGLMDISGEEHSWPNNEIEAYYKIDSVKGITRKEE